MATTLTASLDEAAVIAHTSRPARLGLTLGVGLLCLLMAPWILCVTWTASTVLLEGWGVFSTRAQRAKRTVGRATQLGFAVYFGLVHVSWVILGVLLWRVGTLESQVAAGVLAAAIVALALLLTFQTPLIFLFCGAAPMAAALVVMTISAGHVSLALLPSALGLTFFLLFAAWAARGFPSALSAQRRLAASEAQYRVMADSTSDVVARLGLDRRRKYLSPSVLRLTGYSAEELLEDDALTTIHGDDLARVSAVWSGVGRGDGDATCEYRMVTKQGGVIWVESKITLAAFDGPSVSPEILSVTRDVTARKAMELELIAARDEAQVAQRAAEAASQAKSDFLANMSHELRTPLNAVIGFSRVLRDSELTPTQAHHAKLVAEGGVALLAVINNVLDFSRLEAGAIDLAADPFNPVDLVQSMGELLRLEATNKGITLEVRATGGGEDLLGDAPLVRQVLLNLIGNALKFTERGGVVVSVSQSDIVSERSTLRVAVTDTGIGLSADNLARIFERFEQADASMSRRFGGAGLGLAVSDRLVRLMGGRIGADSVEGKGSTFWFELDLPKAGSIAQSAVAPQPAPADGDEAAERPLRVLVVDDVAANRELVVALLSSFDVVCVTACDGAEALAHARCEAFDIVLMDIQMPVMDGLTATRAIRALDDATFANVPIVALTANVLPEQVARCLEAGMNDHVGKPINTGRLLEVIAQQTDPEARSPPALAAA